MSNRHDRITGWISLWLILAVVWGFISGHAVHVLVGTAVAILVYGILTPVLERRERKRNETKEK